MSDQETKAMAERALAAVLERGGEFEAPGLRVRIPPPRPAPPAEDDSDGRKTLTRLGRQLQARKALLQEE